MFTTNSKQLIANPLVYKSSSTAVHAQQGLFVPLHKWFQCYLIDGCKFCISISRLWPCKRYAVLVLCNGHCSTVPVAYHAVRDK